MRHSLIILWLLAAVPITAQVRPSPSDGDRRIQTIRYDPDQVVALDVAPGYQVSVALLGGERIETIAVGDSAAWQLTASKRGDYLFIKCLAPVMTNATVVTDARVYSFELVAGYSGDAAYVVRFVDANPAPAIATLPATLPAYQYRLSGASALRPSRVTVDGTRTIVEWAPGRAMPAIFRIDEDGDETLVNSIIEDDKVIIDGAPSKLVFRIDRGMAVATRTLPRRRRS